MTVKPILPPQFRNLSLNGTGQSPFSQIKSTVQLKSEIVLQLADKLTETGQLSRSLRQRMVNDEITLLALQQPAQPPAPAQPLNPQVLHQLLHINRQKTLPATATAGSETLFTQAEDFHRPDVGRVTESSTSPSPLVDTGSDDNRNLQQTPVMSGFTIFTPGTEDNDLTIDATSNAPAKTEQHISGLDNQPVSNFTISLAPNTIALVLGALTFALLTNLAIWLF